MIFDYLFSVVAATNMSRSSFDELKNSLKKQNSSNIFLFMIYFLLIIVKQIFVSLFSCKFSF